jgi:hypothetical protein
LIAIEVEPEYRSISRSLSGWGPKGDPNAPDHHWERDDRFVEAIEADLPIGSVHVSYQVEAEYKSVTRSLS